MSSLHMMWIDANLHKDQEEQRESNIALVEYLASFINPKAVKRVRDARENTVRVSDKNLVRALAAIGGRQQKEVEKELDRVK